MDCPSRLQLIVDAMNVIGSRPDGWWRDPDAAKRGLVRQLQAISLDAPEWIILVIDGRPLPDLPEGAQGGIEVLYASKSGPNAADDRIVQLVSRAPENVIVASSDRDLRRRVQELGAEVRGATWLRSRLDGTDRAGSEKD